MFKKIILAPSFRVATEFEKKQARTTECQTKLRIPNVAKSSFTFSPFIVLCV